LIALEAEGECLEDKPGVGKSIDGREFEALYFKITGTTVLD
jgi:hypothetical protein